MQIRAAFCFQEFADYIRVFGSCSLNSNRDSVMLPQRQSFRSTGAASNPIEASAATRGSSFGDASPTGTRTNSVEHDLACGILVGIFEAPGIVVTLEAITVTDPSTRTTSRQTNWLISDDPTGRLARECFVAKLKMSTVAVRGDSKPWERAQAIKAREELANTFRDTRRRLCDVLLARGVAVDAQRRGMRVLFES